VFGLKSPAGKTKGAQRLVEDGDLNGKLERHGYPAFRGWRGFNFFALFRKKCPKKAK
jgi:hypothetical protein